MQNVNVHEQSPSCFQKKFLVFLHYQSPMTAKNRNKYCAEIFFVFTFFLVYILPPSVTVDFLKHVMVWILIVWLKRVERSMASKIDGASSDCVTLCFTNSIVLLRHSDECVMIAFVMLGLGVFFRCSSLSARIDWPHLGEKQTHIRCTDWTSCALMFSSRKL